MMAKQIARLILFGCAVAGVAPQAVAQSPTDSRQAIKREVVLISAEDIARPAQARSEKGAVGTDRGITRGPKIEIVSPVTTIDKVSSPLPLVVTFKTFGGAEIEPRSLKLTYLRNPPLDLTPRVIDFATSKGIVIDRALVAPGTHELRLEISDNQKHTTTADFVIDVKSP